MTTTIALDIGDKWTGIAIADPLGITARPLTTVKATDLIATLQVLIADYMIGTIVVGLPKTLGYAESKQTVKVRQHTDTLRILFPRIQWVFWDERLTSKRAAQLHPTKTPAAKLRSHAIAAAFILEGYLARKAYMQENPLE